MTLMFYYLINSIVPFFKMKWDNAIKNSWNSGIGNWLDIGN